MPARGSYWGSRWGADELAFARLESGVGTFAMAALNSGCAYRFMAQDTRDVASVRLYWFSVSSPGQVTVRIETDAAGKPSGTLADAKAVATGVVPAAGWQQVSF